MQVFIVEEIETKDQEESTTELSGAYRSYRQAAQHLMRRSYKPKPVYTFNQPNRYCIDYVKRDGLFEYEAYIHDFDLEDEEESYE